MYWKALAAVVAAGAVSLAGAGGAAAATTCTFETSGSTMTLQGDCVTDETIPVPDGMTLDGDSHTITAQDPPVGHFTGAVVANGGTEAYVTDLGVIAGGLANVCDAGGDRLRGIMFEGASGAISGSEVTGINQGPSGCQEGNAIEVRNAPFDGDHEDTVTVVIDHNSVDDYQKTGIVANGDVDVAVTHNDVGDSATQENLAANSIQIGFGALGLVQHNTVEGNQWLGTSDYAASAVLVYLSSGGTDVSLNNVRGNSDVGVFAVADGATIDNNRVFDEGADGTNSSYDIGVGSYGDNDVTNNKVRGFDLPYEGVVGGKNKTISGPQGDPAF
jgi:hypothetical protein